MDETMGHWENGMLITKLLPLMVETLQINQQGLYCFCTTVFIRALQWGVQCPNIPISKSWFLHQISNIQISKKPSNWGSNAHSNNLNTKWFLWALGNYLLIPGPRLLGALKNTTMWQSTRGKWWLTHWGGFGQFLSPRGIPKLTK